MGKKDREEEAPPGAPEWIVTFADMTSLLVTFFVMLMTFSTMDKLEMMLIQGVRLVGRGGVAEEDKGHTPYEPSEDDIYSASDPNEGAQIPHSRPEWELNEVEGDMGQRKDPDQLERDLRDIADGLQITFSDEAGFAPGSAVVSPRLRRSLLEISEVLSHYPHLVVVEGFTDDHFQPTPDFPSSQALGVARAAAAAKLLLDGGGLSPRLVQVAGIGAQRFLADNETALDRARNRRVELRVLSTTPGDPRRQDHPIDDSRRRGR